MSERDDGYRRIHAEQMARPSLNGQRNALSPEAAADKIEGLEADLFEAVRVAYQRGAVEWTRLNYPAWYERLKVGGGQPLALTPLERELVAVAKMAEAVALMELRQTGAPDFEPADLLEAARAALAKAEQKEKGNG